jgi:hypothetical protein
VPKLKTQNRVKHSDKPLPDAVADDRVMSFDETARVNSISIWTLRRLIDGGNGPPVTQTSERCQGVTVGNNRRWQQSRTR